MALWFQDAIFRFRRTAAIGFMLISMGCWASLELVFAKLAHYSPVQVVWTRYLFHVLLMLVIFLPIYRNRLWRTRQLPLQIVRGFMMLGVVVFFTLGAMHLKGSDVRTFFAASPLLILFLAPFFLRERVSKWVWAFSILAFLGSVLFIGPAMELMKPAIVLPVLQTLCFASYMLMTRRLRTESIVTNVFYSGWIVLFGLSIAVPSVWVMPSPDDLGTMVVIGAAGLVILGTMETSIHLMEVHRVVPLVFMRGVFSVLLAWGLGHSPRGMAGIGILLTTLGVMLAIVVPLYLERKRRLEGHDSAPQGGPPRLSSDPPHEGPGAAIARSRIRRS